MAKKLPPLKSTRSPPSLPPAEPPSLDAVKETAPPAVVPPPPAPDRAAEALAIVARHRLLALAGGVVPVPLVDMAVISGLQLRMVAQLAKHYGVPFDKVRARSLIATLAGGAIPQGVAAGVAGTTAKALPGVGTVVGIGSAMATAALATDVIGKAFIRHFEAGGTLADG